MINALYDDFDMSLIMIWATISYSKSWDTLVSLMAFQRLLGTIVLAYDVANDMIFHDIENPTMPDRTQWLNDYAHTEYTLEEISQGIPLKNLTSKLI